MNSIKHAFPDDMENKEIYKKIDYADENICQLIIQDNGIGLESPEQLTNHNLGWEIVTSLTKQLNGKIRILESEKGTGFELTFPENFNYTLNDED